jgi:hypothetical protein
MVKVPEHLKDAVYKATQAQVTRDRLTEALRKQKAREARNNKGGKA